MKNSNIKKPLIEITRQANNLIDSSINDSVNLPINQSNADEDTIDNSNAVFEFEILNQSLNEITRSIHEQIENRSGYK
ncbi:24345_t:CDS:2 [Cetraspora pellucida]|uniref:24345_t:CDS:1 n=1 Tax=Cetraspora pellucida TaxID=1433469 RepID=A0A9N8W3P9_9GLOM|nr:24345_t:CDS:2 [Cetraspora pellucida]